jgi:hypothetical protein
LDFEPSAHDQGAGPHSLLTPDVGAKASSEENTMPTRVDAGTQNKYAAAKISTDDAGMVKSAAIPGVQVPSRREMLTLMQKIIDARLEEDLEDPAWVFKTKRELSKATKRDEKTITIIIRKDLKIPGGLDALRRSKLGLKPRRSAA